MVKVGIVGTGFMAKTHADGLKHIDGAALAGFTAVNKEKGRKMSQEYGCEYFDSLDDLLSRNDVQIIDVCVPTHLHEEVVVRAAEAGKHILCEKPFALSMDSVDRMLEAVKKANVKLMLAQVIRFWPEYAHIKRMYDSGELGDINVMYMNRLAQHPNWGDWFYDVSKSGGGLYDLHWHDVDFALHLLGPVDSVYAIGKKFDNGAWNHLVSNLTFKNGAKAAIEGSYVMPEGYPFSAFIRAIGDDAGAEYRFQAGFNIGGPADSELRIFKKGQGAQTLQVEQKDPYTEQLRYFIDCVEKDIEPNFVPLSESREVLRIILAIRESLETGQVIRL